MVDRVGFNWDRDRVAPRRGRFINIVGFANRFSCNLPLRTIALDLLQGLIELW